MMNIDNYLLILPLA